MTLYPPKSNEQIKRDIDTINKNLERLTPDVISQIKAEAGINYDHSVFRPSPDCCLLLFKREKKEPSVYTINLCSLKPTANSQCKMLLSNDILNAFK